MTPQTADSRIERISRRVERSIPWVAMLGVGIAIVLFFTFRGDSIQAQRETLECNSAFQTYQSQAQAERTERNTQKAAALDVALMKLDVLLEQGPSEETLQPVRDAFDTYFELSNELKQTQAEFPYRDYAEFCGGRR